MQHISHLSSAEARRLWECLIAPPPVHILWDNLIDLLSNLFNIERVNLFLVITEKQQLRTRAASEFSWDVVLPWNEGIAGYVYQERTALMINDIPGSNYGHHFNRDPKGFRTHSMLTVPVFRDGDSQQPIVAIIQLVNKMESPFNEQDLEALRYWARQIGVTLERSHGTEIWRHPESEPPYLSDPEFGPILPTLSAEQMAHNLAHSVAAATAEWSEYHLQSRRLARGHNSWENREFIKIVRDECRHLHLVEQLSQGSPREAPRLSLWHRTGIKLFRLMGFITRSRVLTRLMGTYHEWYSFFSSSLLYSLYEGMPRERNILRTIVEDERCHSTFYESRLLDRMIRKPHARQTLKMLQSFVQAFYARSGRSLIMPLVAITRRPDLPEKFARLFRDFTNHRLSALLERAELRAPAPQGFVAHSLAHLRGIAVIAGFSGLAVLLFPIALCWRFRPAISESPELSKQLVEAA